MKRITLQYVPSHLSKIQFRTNCSTILRRGPFSSSFRVGLNNNETRGQQRRSRGFSSVSKEEVTKFSEFSKSWWDPQQNPLIGMNSIRVQYILNEITNKASTSAEMKTHSDAPQENESSPQLVSHPPLTGLKALDVGCGGGLLSESLARLGADVVAVDPSRTLVEHARHHSDMDPRTRSIDYRGGCTIEQLARDTPDSSFDIICILEVVEHATDVESILKSAKSLLKPNTGRLFLSTINRTIKSQIVAIIGAEYVMGYLPTGTHNWNQFLSPQEVEGLMIRCGFRQIDVCGMVVSKPPFNGNWTWRFDCSDTDINWIGTYELV